MIVEAVEVTVLLLEVERGDGHCGDGVCGVSCGVTAWSMMTYRACVRSYPEETGPRDQARNKSQGLRCACCMLVWVSGVLC